MFISLDKGFSTYCLSGLQNEKSRLKTPKMMNYAHELFLAMPTKVSLRFCLVL